MQDASRSVGWKRILKMTLIAVVNWFTLGLSMFLIAKSLSLNLSYLDCMMLHPLLSATMFVPFIPAGLGLTETGSALMFKLIGLQTADGVAFMLLFRTVMILVDSVGVIDMKFARSRK